MERRRNHEEDVHVLSDDVLFHESVSSGTRLTRAETVLFREPDMNQSGSFSMPEAKKQTERMTRMNHTITARDRCSHSG